MTLEIDVQWMDPPSDEIARGPDASTWARVRVAAAPYGKARQLWVRTSAAANPSAIHAAS